MPALSAATAGALPAVLCLDLDHCLARYRVHALQRLIYACLSRALAEQCGAPAAAFLAPLPADAADAAAPAAPADVDSGELFPAAEPPASAALDFTDVDAWARGWAPHLSQ